MLTLEDYIDKLDTTYGFSAIPGDGPYGRAPRTLDTEPRDDQPKLDGDRLHRLAKLDHRSGTASLETTRGSHSVGMDNRPEGWEER